MGRHVAAGTPPGIPANLAYRAARVPRCVGDYLARTGIVRPSVAEAAGRGTARLYSLSDVVALRVVRELREAGLPLQRVHRALRALSQRWPGTAEPLASFVLVTDGRDLFRVVGEAEARTLVSLARRPGQLAWHFVAVDVTAAAVEVRRALRRAGVARGGGKTDASEVAREPLDGAMARRKVSMRPPPR